VERALDADRKFELSNIRVDTSGATHKVWPFYVVCDVSESMWNEERWENSDSPHAIMNASLGLMLDTLNDNHQAAAIGRICIITFAENASTHYPLTRIDDPRTLSPLPRGSWTNFEDVWRHLDRVVKRDVAELKQEGYSPKQPVIFFITDGNPGSDKRTQTLKDWKPFHDSLCSPKFRERPRIVALGMGDVNAETVINIRSSDPAGPACLAKPGEPASTLLEAVIDVVINSIGSTTTSGSFKFKVPSGMSRLDGATGR